MTLRQFLQEKIQNSHIAFKEVAGAADLAAILAGRISSPGCYLFRKRNKAGANQSSQSVIQDVDQTISLIIVVKNVADAKGGDSSDDCEVFCKQLADLLLNFIPSDEYEPLHYAGGGLITFKGGVFVWEEMYSTSKIIKSLN